MKHLIVTLISATAFFSCANQNTEGIEVVTLVETTTSWDGSKLPIYPESQPKVTVLKITIPPKAKLHKHYHPVINSGYILSGELMVVNSKNDTLHLQEGDVIVELVNTVHHGENTGEVPVELVVFYAGAEDMPITVLVEE